MVPSVITRLPQFITRNGDRYSRVISDDDRPMVIGGPRVTRLVMMIQL